MERSSEQTPRIADRLALARRGRFVGRTAELELFRSALIASEPSFSVLFLHGPGGVGKTTLLRAFASIALDLGRTVVQIDGRNVDPSPAGFQVALCESLRLEDESASAIVARWPPAGVFLIDTYESLTPLDGWLRETFLPQLPAESIVVIAGRKPPMPAWRTDLDWAQITRISPVGNLRPEESRTFLTTRGVPDDRHPDALALTHGHPLALTLVADMLSQGDQLSSMSLTNEPDVVHVLLERLVHDVPSARHRQALEICVLVWATTEALLAEVLETPDAHHLFEWLRQLSFIESGTHGLYPHDVAREALYADLRWRNPDGLRQLIHRLSATIHTKFQQARGIDQQRIWFDVLYLTRHNPFMRPYFEWEALGSAFAEPASAGDHPAILEMVRQHQGEDAERIARYWLGRQPAGFLAYRSSEGELIGFMAQLALHEATEDDLRVDPALPAALDFVRRHGPVRA
ncbi:MAG: ATP-binding protein, partial [Vicinamibacterales bacterium]